MYDGYVTTSRAAQMLNVRPRTIRRHIEKGRYEVREERENNRKTYSIRVSSLPVPPPAEKMTKKSELSIAFSSCERFQSRSEKQREKAIERYDILRAWDEYAQEKGVGPSLCADDYIRERVNIEVTRSTLYRWKRLYRENGLDGLVPEWTNPRKPIRDDFFSPAAKSWVEDHWLHPSRPTMQHSYDCLCDFAQAQGKGWNIPSYTTVRRFLNAIPEPVKIKFRHGNKAFNDEVLPPILRDYSSLQPMDIVECDHHQLDVAVLFPDGIVRFPWLTTWIDVRTRKILSWALVSKPNSDSINISFRELILKYGIPQEAHLDNGKDFRAKWFNGRNPRAKGPRFEYSLNESYYNGIFNDLGVKTSWAIPYNAKAKMIERFFKTLRTRFSIDFPGYRGKNTLERPEKLNREWREKLVPTLEEMKEHLHAWIDVKYNSLRKHRGDAMENRTPDAVFYELKKTKKAVREEELVLLCSQAPKSKTVQKNGIEAFKGVWYWSEKIQMEYFGQKLFYRYIDDDDSKIYLFDTSGKYVGIAYLKDNGNWKMKDTEYQKQMRFKKSVKESCKKWEKEHIPVRMKDKERAKLPTYSIDVKEFKEPELTPQFVQTKYAPVIAAAAMEKDKRQKNIKAQKDFTSMFADIPPPDEDSQVKDMIGKYMNEHGRKT